MVNTFENVYSNLNEVYMAGLMTAPMVVIELVVWGSYARSHMTLRHPFDRLGRQAAA